MNQNSIDTFVKDFSFDPKTGKDRHDYLLNGKPLTSVTTILKIIGKGDFITQWASNLAVEENDKYAWKKALEKAGKFGTNVHKAVELFVTNSESGVALTSQEQTAFDNFKNWYVTNNVKLIESEKTVYSKSSWYAGTIDLILEIEGKIWIADVKTSSAIYPEYFFQTAAYQKALVELGFDREITGHIIINVKKTGEIVVKRSYGYERNLEAFLNALEIYRIKADLEKELKIK